MAQSRRGGSETVTGQGTGLRTSRSPQQGELRLLLLGKCGAGKSATGNTILGEDVFTSKFSEKMVTKSCQRKSGATRREKVVVIDTPDLFSSAACAEDSLHNIERCLELSAPSLQALLLVVPIGRYTAEDRETMEGIQRVFGTEARRHTIIVFTRKDDLGDDSMEDYLGSDSSLEELVKTCGNLYCTFNNKAGETERQRQADELLCAVRRLVDKNGELCCVNRRRDGLGTQDGVKEAMSQKGDTPSGPWEQQLQAAGSELNPEMPELRVLLLGKRGVGKSTAGNSLLGKRVFETKFSDDSVTQKFMSESRTWNKRKILVIDSPDLSKDFQSDLQQHALRGPHAFLLVTPVHSFTCKDQEVLDNVQKVFHGEVVNYTIVLFTRKEDLGGEKVDVLSGTQGDLRKLLEEGESRYSVFDYRATEQEAQRQVDEVLQKVVSLVQRNGNRPCSFREKTLGIVLVGRSGTGKSAAGNTILGRPDFLSELRAQPVTKTCQESRRTWLNQDVVVVDTPDICLMLSVEGDRFQLQEVQRYVSSSEWNTVLVLVLQLGRITQKDAKAVEMLETVFGKRVTEHMIVLFTRKEDLGDGTLSDFYKKTDNNFLKKIIKKCGSRVCGFNNKETDKAREEQATELLKMAKELILKHGGCGYSCAQEDIQEVSRFKKCLNSVKDKILSVIEIPDVTSG